MRSLRALVLLAVGLCCGYSVSGCGGGKEPLTQVVTKLPWHSKDIHGCGVDAPAGRLEMIITALVNDKEEKIELRLAEEEYACLQGGGKHVLLTSDGRNLKEVIDEHRKKGKSGYRRGKWFTQ